jgi:hypothetical protein
MHRRRNKINPFTSQEIPWLASSIEVEGSLQVEAAPTFA